MNSRDNMVFFDKQTSGVLIAFIFIIAIFSSFASDFLSMATWSSIFASAADSGIIVLGVTLLMIAGEFDLSVGANLALSGMTFAFMITNNMNSMLALGVTLILGSSIGLLNGFITIILKIPSFIATLSTMLLLRGLVLLFTEGYPITMDTNNSLMELFAGNLTPTLLASLLWWLAIGFYLTYLLNQTKLGNHIYATGSNVDHAYSMGINTKMIRLFCFTLCGLLASLAGIIQFSHISTLAPTAGDQYELYAIAAAVIGGAALTGGKGSMIGAIVGTLLISTIDTGLVQIGVSTYWYRAFVGLILIFAVAINLHSSKLIHDKLSRP